VKVPEVGMLKHEVIENCFHINIYLLKFFSTPHFTNSGYKTFSRHNALIFPMRDLITNSCS
jgi:hypothetical protein